MPVPGNTQEVRATGVFPDAIAYHSRKAIRCDLDQVATICLSRPAPVPDQQGSGIADPSTTLSAVAPAVLCISVLLHQSPYEIPAFQEWRGGMEGNLKGI